MMTYIPELFKLSDMKINIKLSSLIIIFILDNIFAETTEESIYYDYCVVTGDCGPDSDIDILEKYRPLGYYKTVDKVQLINCPPPLHTYASALDNLNINISNDGTLILKSVKKELTSHHMMGLKIVELGLSNVNVDASFLRPLVKLRRLYVQSGRLPPLPLWNMVQYLTLEDADILDSFGDCTKLVGLIILKSSLSLPAGWLKYCINLKELEFQNTDVRMIKRALSGLSGLSAFRAYDCGLDRLPSELAVNTGLRRLDLRRNNLHKISHVLKSFPKLEILMISESNLSLPDLGGGLETLRALSMFRMGGQHQTVCGDTTLTINAVPNKIYREGYYLVSACRVKTQNPQCSYVLQWHQLGRGSNVLSERTWRAASFRSPVYWRKQLSLADNGTRLICRMVKTRTQGTPGLTLLVDREDATPSLTRYHYLT